MSGDDKSQRNLALVAHLEGDEDVTVVSTYSWIILASLLALALLSIAISEIARRKKWKYCVVDIIYLEKTSYSIRSLTIRD